MDNVYLISSSSYYLMEDEIKKIIGDNIHTTYDLNNDLLEDVLEEASYFSLFDDKKYMVVRNADIFKMAKRKKKDEEGNEEDTPNKDKLLLNYLENPNPNTVIIFTVFGNVATNKKIYKTISSRYKYINIPTLKPSEIYDRVNDIFKKDGYKINKDGIYYIINNSLNNYDLVINEIRKIELYYLDNKVIKQEDLENIVSNNMVDNNFKFIDAVLDKNLKQSIKCYDDLMIQKQEPIMLLIMISKDIRSMLLIKKMLNTKSKFEMKSILGIKFDFQLDKLINRSYKYKEEKLEEYLVYICDMDYKIKNGKVTAKNALLLTILKICE